MQKFNCSNKGQGALSEAKNGIFAQSKKPGGPRKNTNQNSNHWDTAYDLHDKSQKGKDEFALKRLQQGDAQLKVMQGPFITFRSRVVKKLKFKHH